MDTAESPPGCLVILIPLSAGMVADGWVWLAHRLTAEGESDVRDLPGEFAARFLADELLEGLVNTQAAGYPVPLDVMVLGYNASEDGKLKLVSLLVGHEPKDRFVALADVANLPAEPRTREGDPRKWTTALPCDGTAPAAAALAEVYLRVGTWLTGRFTARPPVVIHCTGGEGLDETYARVARSLGLLVTAYGPARLLHYSFAAGFEPTLSGLWPQEIPEPWAGLFESSAELPAEPEGRASRRAVSVNDWTIADAWSAVFDLTSVEDTTDWTAPDEGRFLPTVRELWTQKMGNKTEEWEDACATDSASGVAVVADGASSGIYCRIWADQLVKRFIADRPDARDPLALGKWVHGLRGEWRSAIDYPSLNWAKQRKVDDPGAAATLLGLEVGPLDATGNRPWRGCAVGDATLFWVRDGRLHASFPVVGADQFGSAPLLIRSNPPFRTVALAAAGVCQPGDRFLLATDAVAARLLKSEASSPGPDWEQFETIEEDVWRKDMDDFRKTHEMVNDDCTLVAIRVAGNQPLPSPVSPPGESSEVSVEVPASESIPGALAAWNGVPEDAPVPAVEEPPTELTELPAQGAEEMESSPVARNEDEPRLTAPELPVSGHEEPGEPGSEHVAEETGKVTPESEQPIARDGFSASTDKPSD